MISQQPPSDYRHQINHPLLQSVPAEARRILEVGCGEGRLGQMLKLLNPNRSVYGIDLDLEAVTCAQEHLDQAYCFSVEEELPPLEPGSLDCILFGDILEHLVDPETVLGRYRDLLCSSGSILCSVPNVQHHSILRGLLRGDFQYQPHGLLDATHLRFFTWSTMIKMLLDTGFAPTIVHRITSPASPSFYQALLPLFNELGLSPGRAQRYLDTYQYILRGDRLSAPETGSQPFTFVVAVSDPEVLESCFLRSPCLEGDSPHQVVLAHNPQHAAEAITQGLKQAEHSWVIFAHQDVYLPQGWPEQFTQQLNQAKDQGLSVGVAGVFGMARTKDQVQTAGQVVDREQILRGKPGLPALVESLEELLLALPGDTTLRPDPALGFHWYGADLCCQARQAGLQAVALEALCFHHSQTVQLPDAFYASARVFARKWKELLPIQAPCARIEADGTVIEPRPAPLPS